MPRLVLIALTALAATLPPACFLMTSPSEPVEDVAESYVPPRGYVCYRALTPPRIDGRLDDEAWRAVPWTEDFVDIEGDKKPRPRFRTRAKMLWDDDYFYVGAELEEPHVWATVKRHDAVIFEDNDFEVFIDPDGDSHEYYEFEMNALNTTWDLFLPKPYKDHGSALNGWEIAGLRTAVCVDGTLNDPRDTDRGWSVEIAFPWKVLNEQAHWLKDRPAHPVDGDQWRVNFSRVEWRHKIVGGKYERFPKTRESNEDNWVWSPQGVIDMHRPETWGYVQFSTAPPGTAHFVPDPSGPARHALHRIYYAEKAYHDDHGRWGRTLRELGVPRLTHPSFLGAPRLMTTDGLFEATVEIGLPGGGKRRCHIRDDARVWTD
jgi:hypothetical protein